MTTTVARNWIGIEEAAELFGLSRRSIERIVTRYAIAKSCPLGHRVLLRLADLEKAMESAIVSADEAKTA
jgi:excisionase family DNA binding protein